MGKKGLEFTPFTSFAPREDTLVKGLTQRIISTDERGRCVSRIVEYAPGTDASAYGVREHDFREEIIILRGSLTDLTLGRTFTAGDAASRPPHMKHGPWRSEDGCVMYEVDLYPD